MKEANALEVTAVRAIETTDRARALWSDADRAWASRAAAEVVGEGASVDDFVARRAKLALERIGSRQPALTRAVAALRWRQWVGAAVVVVAFLAGMAFNRIGSGERINLLAPPVLALLAWNVVVYLLLLVAPLLRAGEARKVAGGFLRRLVARVAGGAVRVPRDRTGPTGEAVATFAADWTRFAAPLYAARTARILHFAAAAFAVGVVSGLYLRGLAVEYRATWESTFLDPATVHALLSFALWPGRALTGIPIPSLEAIAAIRSGGQPASENAAQWLHLLAATVAAVVIVPRVALGFLAWAVEHRRASRVKLPLNEPYFNRVVRGFKGGPVRLKVVPYSYQVPPDSLGGLQTVVARTFGGSAAMVCASPVNYGEEDALPKAALARWQRPGDRPLQPRGDARARGARRVRRRDAQRRRRPPGDRARRRSGVSRPCSGGREASRGAPRRLARPLRRPGRVAGVRRSCRARSPRGREAVRRTARRAPLRKRWA